MRRSAGSEIGGRWARRSAATGALLGLALACSTASARLPDLQQTSLLPRLPAADRASAADAPIAELPSALLEREPPPVQEPPSRSLPDAVGTQIEELAQPLVATVEEVVESSAAGPTGARVESLVDGGAGGADAGSARASAAQSGEAPESAAGSGGSLDPVASETVGSERSSTDGRRPRGRSSTDGRGPRGRTRTAMPGGSASRSRVAVARAAEGRVRSASRRRAGEAAGHNSPLPRTIREIVHIVPEWVWVALAALLALALAFGARSLVDKRRARALEWERERLLCDVGALERALLPAVPARLGALSMSVAYRSAMGLGAGGDFYDAFELDAGRAAILVGDVSGHGPEALGRTGPMRAALRACLEAGMSPRDALASATRAWRDDPEGCFATVVVAVHDPSTHTLTYAGAGHPAPILVGPAAHDPITVAAAPPIGVGLPTGLRQTTVPFTRGSAACFFTDGLIEARAGDGLIGRERLTAIVAGLRPGDRAEGLVVRLIEAVDKTKDSITACLVRAELGGVSVDPRLEEVELEADELEVGLGERFLTACGVPALASAAALEEARSIAADARAAVLLVTFDNSMRRVSVEPPAGAGPRAEAPAAVVDFG